MLSGITTFRLDGSQKIQKQNGFSNYHLMTKEKVYRKQKAHTHTHKHILITLKKTTSGIFHSEFSLYS